MAQAFVPASQVESANTREGGPRYPVPRGLGRHVQASASSLRLGRRPERGTRTHALPWVVRVDRVVKLGWLIPALIVVAVLAFIGIEIWFLTQAR